MLKALGERKGEVIAKYGEMTEASAAAESPWAREPGLGWQVGSVNPAIIRHKHRK